MISCLEAPALSRADIWYAISDASQLATYLDIYVLQLIHRPASTAVPTANGTGKFTSMTIPFASMQLVSRRL